MIEVKEEANGSFTINWDENDPLESMLNTWKEDDFVNAISQQLNMIIENEITLEHDDCAT